MKKLIRKLTPRPVISAYHLSLAWSANVFYGRPSNKMVIIGITGTKGKTSTANFTWAALQGAGHKVGLLSTSVIRIGNKEIPNSYHMTMPGRFLLQQWLKKMHDAGCTHVIIETSSQGILQWRHVGISYDVGIFTNLSPEHLASHNNSLDHYRKTKGKLFEAIAKRKPKRINGELVKTMTLVNIDDPAHAYFGSFGADVEMTFGEDVAAKHKIASIQTTTEATRFTLDGQSYSVSILGGFNALNAAPGIILAQQDAEPSAIQSGLDLLKIIPGRMEIMQTDPYYVIVDYAHEAVSMRLATEAARKLATGKVIVLLGAEGGGRDIAKRGAMGRVVGELADIVIASNVDPYEDDPTCIAQDVADGARSKGKTDGKDLFVIEDRRLGMEKAFEIAAAGDVLIFTGKGAEDSMIIDGKTVEWDDRVEARDIIDKLARS